MRKDSITVAPKMNLKDHLNEIRQRTDIVEIVSRHVSLKPTGRNHLGLCPFHAEKTPSFSVSRERGFFHCFGCGQSGDVFKFLMRMENLPFSKAVQELAIFHGLDLDFMRKLEECDKIE